MQYLQWKWLQIDHNFTEIIPSSDWQLANIGSYNGLVPIKPQAVIWTNDCIVSWHRYGSLGLNELSISVKLCERHGVQKFRQIACFVKNLF